MKRSIKGPVVLVVLDGWGIRKETVHNAIAIAKTPNVDRFIKTFPFTQLFASGEPIGLPSGQIGNSEVGHMTIGAGCILYQELVRISNDIASGGLEHNPAFRTVFNHVKTRGSQIHIIGLFSPGGVHSHEEHFIQVIKAASKAGIHRIILHPFLDGRDTPKTSGMKSLKKLEEHITTMQGCYIGSVIGRYYSMDRDTNWDRTDKAFNAIFNGKADHVYDSSVSPSIIIQEWYHSNVFDEHLEPLVFKTDDGVLEVRDGDGIVFTNFRTDRTKQLSKKICEQAKDKDLCFVTMTDYGNEVESLIAFGPQEVKETIGSVISKAGLTQARIAETEKYPHATYFLNAGRQTPYNGEEDVLIPSRRDIKTHDQAPEMRAREITDEAITRLGEKDFIFINYANADMVGHSANKDAIIIAVETVDRELGRLTNAVLKHNGAVLIIADHGNAEMIIDPVTGEPHTAHTTNPVPCILIHETFHPDLRHDEPGLDDVAPTILELLGLKQPESMTGESIIVK